MLGDLSGRSRAISGNLGLISVRCQVDLGSISGQSRVDLGSISGRSRVDLGSISDRSRVKIYVVLASCYGIADYSELLGVERVARGPPLNYAQR